MPTRIQIEAERMAFRAVPQTCPAIDDDATKRLKDANDWIRQLGDFVEGIISDGVDCAKNQTEALRAALCDAYERVVELEEANTELEDKVSRLKDEVCRLEGEVDHLEYALIDERARAHIEGE